MRAFALLLVVACTDDMIQSNLPTSCAWRNYFELEYHHDLDMLFVIDDSPAMSTYQAALEANAPVFMNVLESLPAPPDLHLAVARASDGGLVDPVPCGAEAGATFLTWSHQGAVQNFTGTLPDVFTCMTRVGTSGGRQQVLASGLSALERRSGFLRVDAYLAAILITATDDGSTDEPINYFLEFGQLESVPNHVVTSAITHVPAQRLQAFLEPFGNLGTMVSIDQQSWVDAFSVFARNPGGQLGAMCLGGMLVQPPNCTFTLIQNIGTPAQQQIGTLPMCDPNGQASGACVGLVPDSVHCLSQTRIVFCWNGFDPTSGIPCPNGPNDPPGSATVVIDCAVECQ